MIGLVLPQAKTDFTPRQLVLDLLDADPEVMGATTRLLPAGELFGFSHNQMRVALSRLVSAGLLRNHRRGYYRLTGDGAALRKEIQHWRHLEDRLVDWQGDWCGILTQNLAAEGSSQFRHQTRALMLRGLRRWRPGIWVRPNNLQGGLKQLTADLSALGLDALQGGFLIEQPDNHCEQELCELWPTDELEGHYEKRIRAITQARQRLNSGDLPDKLIETMQLGGDTIRFLLKDPLLPKAMFPALKRRELIQLMDCYDREGRQLWLQFINSLEAPS